MSRCSSAVEQSFVLYRVHLVLTFPKLQHLAVHLCVFFKDNVWESAQAAAVSWCDGYDEGQGAPASTSKLWSHGYTFPYTCTHAISQTRLLQEIHGRGTHTSLLICLTTTAHTHKYLISHNMRDDILCLRTALSLTASTLPPNRNVFGAVRHNNREDNLLVVLRQLFRQVSQIIWAFVLAPQSLPHFNHSERKLDYIMIS